MSQNINKKKVVIVGTGRVGMSYAYSMLNAGNVCDELVLIDRNEERNIGEAMDLNHGLAFSSKNMEIYAGDYSDCKDSDVVTICAGFPRNPGDTRLDLLNKNVEIYSSIIPSIMKSGFNGCFLVVSNPVDIMSYVTQKLSGLDPRRVIGSGTLLDTARLRYVLGDRFGVSPKNIHAYVMGEHGDSEFVPWSQAYIGTMSVADICRKSDVKCNINDLENIACEVKDVAAKVIKAKGATHYSIGMALGHITRSILADEHAIMPLSVMPNGQYGLEDAYIGLPCTIGINGVEKILDLSLTENELLKLKASCKVIRDMCKTVKF